MYGGITWPGSRDIERRGATRLSLISRLREAWIASAISKRAVSSRDGVVSVLFRRTRLRREIRMPVEDTARANVTEFFEAAVYRFCRREADRYFSQDDLSEALTYDEWEAQVNMAGCMMESLLEQGKDLWKADQTAKDELDAGTFSIGMTIKAIAVLASLAGVDLMADTSRRTNGELE